MALEKEVIDALKDFVENVVDTEKKDDTMFENHMDEEVKEKIDNMDIEETSTQIAKNVQKTIERFKQKGLL